jgi:hypothetical protein
VTVAVEEKPEQLHREHEWGITEASDDAESVQPAVSSSAGREALGEGVRYAYDAPSSEPVEKRDQVADSAEGASDLMAKLRSLGFASIA